MCFLHMRCKLDVWTTSRMECNGTVSLNGRDSNSNTMVVGMEGKASKMAVPI